VQDDGIKTLISQQICCIK